MTMLTPTHGRFERAAFLLKGRDGIEAARADELLAKVRRFCVSALLVVMAGVALAAIMALKVVCYLPRFHY